MCDCTFFRSLKMCKKMCQKHIRLFEKSECVKNFANFQIALFSHKKRVIAHFENVQLPNPVASHNIIMKQLQQACVCRTITYTVNTCTVVRFSNPEHPACYFGHCKISCLTCAFSSQASTCTALLFSFFKKTLTRDFTPLVILSLLRS